MTTVAEIAAGLTEKQREAFEVICRENVALRVAMRGGCFANNEGLHSTVTQGGQEFCYECGDNTKGGKSIRPWFNDERLERIMQRAVAAHLKNKDA